ncbi:MAG: hypothetical protein AAF790_09030, partial [Planctomycetota bacterium]
MAVTEVREKSWEARKKYAEYLKALKGKHADAYRKDFEALKRAYLAIARGKRVIDLFETIRLGGVDEQNRPRLAVVRADATWCWYQSRGSGRPYPVFSRDSDFWGSRKRSYWIELPATALPLYRPGGERHGMRVACRAVVPSIPPALLPDAPLRRFHILWEADWENVPVDPMLLKHLGKNLY